MAAGFLDLAFTELQASVDEIRSHVRFAAIAIRLRPRLRSAIVWDGMDSELQTIVKLFLTNQCQSSVSLEGLLVRLVAAFEAFVRRIVRDSIIFINSQSVPYDQLDITFRKRNRRNAGNALRTIMDPSEHFNLDFDTLCAELGTCVPESRAARLSGEAFSMMVGNIRAESIEKALSMLAVRVDWDRIGRNGDLQRAVNSSGTRKTAKAIKDLLADAQKRRNVLAHAGLGGAELDADWLISLGTCFASLGSEIRVMLEEQLGPRYAKPKGQ